MAGSDDHLGMFNALRPRLMGLAYRMTGTVSDSEDVVQEAWLRWQGVSGGMVDKPASYLFRVVARLCIDRAKSAKARREVYVGPWLPEPVVEPSVLGMDAHDRDPVELADDISMALLMVLELLSPTERAVFLLHDVFDFTFVEIASMLDRTPAACRQLGSRARRRVRQERPTRPLPSAVAGEFTERFLRVLHSGDVAAFAQALAEDARLVADGGGKVYAALNPIAGRDHIVRFLMGLVRKFGAPRSVEATWLNGAAGLVVREADGTLQAWQIDWNEAGQIRTIHLVRNPEKLVGVSRKFGSF